MAVEFSVREAPEIDLLTIPFPGMEDIRKKMVDQMFDRFSDDDDCIVTSSSELEQDQLTIPMPGFYSPLEALNEYYRDDEEIDGEEEQLLKESFIDSFANSGVLDLGYRYFVSNSRGKSRGRNRKPSETPRFRRPREVELIGVTDGSWIAFKDGGGKLDRYTPSGTTEEELVAELQRREDGMNKYGLQLRGGKLTQIY